MAASYRERKGYLPSLIGLGDLFLKQKRSKEFQEVIRILENNPQAKKECLLLQARRHLEAKKFGPACRMVRQIIQDEPNFLAARIVLSHILLHEGKDWKAAEKALKDILVLDPNNKDARQNLKVLEEGIKKVQPPIQSRRWLMNKDLRKKWFFLF